MTTRLLYPVQTGPTTQLEENIQHAAECLLHAHRRDLPICKLQEKCRWRLPLCFRPALRISDTEVGPLAGFICVVDRSPTTVNFRDLVGCIDDLILLPSKNSCSSKEMLLPRGALTFSFVFFS